MKMPVLLSNAATTRQSWQCLPPLADLGNALAQTGLSFSDGRGVPQDDAKAAAWFRKAADQGYAPAQDDLSWMYVEVEGVPQDYVLAHMWANLAASRATDAMTRDIGAKERDSLFRPPLARIGEKCKKN